LDTVTLYLIGVNMSAYPSSSGSADLGITRFAVIVRESGDAAQIEQSGEMVRSRVAPQVRELPAFVSALWTSDGEGGTLNVLVFESEDAARAALEGSRTAPRPPFMKLEAVDLVRVLATA
jgi:hypothetical protein